MVRLLDKDVRFNCPVGPYTTFRVGGKAEALCAVKDLLQLKDLLSFVSKESLPFLVVGKGSNLLVRDGGLKGIVLLLEGELEGVEEKDGTIHAGGGLGLSELVRFSHKKGLAGLEFLAGIPGTVGGAVAMNAGAWGRSTGEAVTAVEIVTGTGREDHQEQHGAPIRLQKGRSSRWIRGGEGMVQGDSGFSGGHRRKDSGLFGEAESQPAAGVSERRLCFQESSGRLCREAH